MTKFSYVLMGLISIGLITLYCASVSWASPLAWVIVFSGSLVFGTIHHKQTQSHPGDRKVIIDSNENQSSLLEISQDCLNDLKISGRESQFTRSDSNNAGAKLAIRQVNAYPWTK